jgi:protein O-GlcNAc transferase
VSKFLKKIDRLAPWFAPTRLLMLPSWEKLRREIAKEETKGKVKTKRRSL